MGISRDKFHKRRKTGGRRKPLRGKRQYELGRAPSNTKLGHAKITRVRVRGGNYKMRALRLDHANYGWASEGIAKRTRIMDVVYNPSSNELVRTKSLTKSTIVQIDAAPFRQWYESHYALPLGRKAAKKTAVKKEEDAEKKNEDLPPYERERSKTSARKYIKRQKNSFVDVSLADQFYTGRLLAAISASPGQSGRADGYILEGNELQFYMKKLKSKRLRIPNREGAADKPAHKSS